MALMIVRHKVKDFAAWKKGFDAHAGAQRSVGLTNPRVFHSSDNHNEMVVLFDASDVAAAKKFVASPDLKSAMEKAGVVDQPTILIVEKVD